MLLLPSSKASQHNRFKTAEVRLLNQLSSSERLHAARCTDAGMAAPGGGHVHVKQGYTLAGINCLRMKTPSKKTTAGSSPVLETTGYASAG